MDELHSAGKIWIVQRSLDFYQDAYENWEGYCEEPMSCLEALRALQECKDKWPQYRFRLHYSKSMWDHSTPSYDHAFLG